MSSSCDRLKVDELAFARDQHPVKHVQAGDTLRRQPLASRYLIAVETKQAFNPQQASKQPPSLLVRTFALRKHWSHAVLLLTLRCL